MGIKDTVLKIPGLTGTYTFYHLSDAHIACATEADSEHDKSLAEQHAVRWSHKGTMPMDALERTLAYIDEQGGDGVFACGDMVDYLHPSNYAYLQKTFGAMKTEVIYVCGNHEGASYECIINHTDCYPIVAPMMAGSPSAYVKDFGELLVVALDDGKRTVSEEQLAFLKKQAMDGRPILLLLHVPIWTEAIHQPILDHWSDEGHRYFSVGKVDPTPTDDAFLTWIASEESHIVAIFAGHVHFSHEGEFAPGRKQYTSAPAFKGYLRRITVCGA